MSRIAAAILAGGRGERLGGVDKAQLKLGGRRLIDHALDAAGDAEPILVLRAAGARPLSLPADITCLPDLAVSLGGPLAGLVAAVAHLMTVDSPPDYLLTLAVDTPFHPKSFAAIARERLDQGDLAAIAAYNGQAYPTNALWRLAVLADLPRRAMGGQAPRSMMALAGELGAIHLDWPEEVGGNPFDNANTVFELMNLERRAIRNFGLGKANQTR